VLSTRRKILVSESEGFSTGALQELSAIGEVMLADLDRGGLLNKVKDADVLWVRLRHLIDDEVLAQAPRLKIIVSGTTGLNHIDLNATDRRGVRVISLRGETEFLRNVRATAELTVGLLLALSRRLAVAAADVCQGNWNRDKFKGRELYEKTAGVVGYGRLGRIVARYLQAFDMRLLATDPFIDPAAIEASVEIVSLPALLAEADVVTLHVDLNDNTRSFFGAREFAAMKRGAYFINTSRGELIDEHALQSALESGHLGGAALDVLANETSAGVTESALIAYAGEHENLIVTPHIGGCTIESLEMTELFLANKLRSFIGTYEQESAARATIYVA
jgi:D-3-phosphoglycerate dehydrogenase